MTDAKLNALIASAVKSAMGQLARAQAEMMTRFEKALYPQLNARFQSIQAQLDDIKRAQAVAPAADDDEPGSGDAPQDQTYKPKTLSS
jgi:hypothetical protein